MVTVVAGELIAAELISVPSVSCLVADHWVPRLEIRQSVSFRRESAWARPRGGESEWVASETPGRARPRRPRAAGRLKGPTGVLGRGTVGCSVPACSLLAAVVVAEEGSSTPRAEPPARNGLGVEIAGEEQTAPAALSGLGLSRGHVVHGTRFLAGCCTLFLDFCN